MMVPHQADLINQLYQGKLKDYVRCLECGNESWRNDTYLDIPLVIRPFGASQVYGSVVRQRLVSLLCVSTLCTSFPPIASNPKPVLGRTSLHIPFFFFFFF